MKKIFLVTFFILLSLHAKAIFPFKEVNSKWNISLNGGYNHSMKAGLYGFGLTIKGVHLTLGGIGSSHKHDVQVDTWNEKASFLFHAGYQIPITQSFRIIPVIGTTGVGTVVTDGSDWNISNGVINNVTAEDITYKFDYGMHFVYNHRKLIVNLAASRYTIFAGIGLEF